MRLKKAVFDENIEIIKEYDVNINFVEKISREELNKSYRIFWFKIIHVGENEFFSLNDPLLLFAIKHKKYKVIDYLLDHKDININNVNNLD
jgi:hypothetical protein